MVVIQGEALNTQSILYSFSFTRFLSHRVFLSKVLMRQLYFQSTCTLFPSLGFCPTGVFPSKVLMRHVL